MIALPFIYFLFLGVFFLLKNKMFGIEVAATSILVAISFCAIMIDIKDIYGEYGINKSSCNLFTLLLFCFQWTVALLPLYQISRLKIVAPDPIKEKTLLIICILLSLSSIIMIISSLEDIRDALIMDMADVRAQHMKDLNAGTEKGSYLLAIPQILVSIPFPTIAIILLFYLCAYIKDCIFVKAGLFFAAIVQAVLAIIIAGRAAMIYLVFDSFLIFCLAYSYLSKTIKRFVVTLSVIVGSVITVVFSLITLSRFDNGDLKYDPFESLYGYAGQHINNFSIMMMEGHNVPFSFDREFPFISKTFFNKIYDMNDHYNVIAKYTKITPNVFDTFGGEVYIDLGIVGYITLLLLLFLFAIYIQQKWEEITLPRVFIIGVYVAFFTHGLFAWPFIGHYASMALMTILLLVLFFSVRFKI